MYSLNKIMKQPKIRESWMLEIYFNSWSNLNDSVILRRFNQLPRWLEIFKLQDD